MRVLLIEDYGPLRKSVTQGLREAGFAVDATKDGDEGLAYAEAGDYDAILLDLMLPKMDGLTLLKRLRESGNAVHILVLTAKDTLEDRVTGLNLGADDYLVKPFAFEELLARIHALVRRKYNAKSSTIRIGDLQIDRTAKTVSRAGHPIDLTAHEYSILEILALKAESVVTRSMIWDRIYTFDAEPNSNVIEVFIGNLRKKLERDGLPRLIHTRRGLGYVLREP
ncbi:MAG: response regulator transcription factor [Candidatus Hydrogenedentes bacterium]|nr:response regulator transcription factor [Candidatus Hydrogenedentota bacterium]